MASALAIPSKTKIIEQLEERTTLLSVRDVAALLNKSPKTIYNTMKTSTLPRIKLGYGVRFDPQKVAAWLKEHQTS